MNRKLDRLMLAIIAVGPAHMGEQLIFGIEEFYLLRDGLGGRYVMFPAAAVAVAHAAYSAGCRDHVATSRVSEAANFRSRRDGKYEADRCNYCHCCDGMGGIGDCANGVTEHATTTLPATCRV